MPTCKNCGAVWTDQQILEGEGLEHFFAPNEKRTVIEPNGAKWVVVFHRTKGIKELEQCAECPVTLGLKAAQA